jgi:hypothetical protein
MMSHGITGLEKVNPQMTYLTWGESPTIYRNVIRIIFYVTLLKKFQPLSVNQNHRKK